MSATLIQAPAYNTPEWVEWRRQGLGASDLPAIVGCDPWKGEYQLWAEKRGDVPAFAGNERTEWGHRMEAVGIEVHQERTGIPVVTGETFGLPSHPHLWATLDGRQDRPDARIGVEVKWTSQRWEGLPQRVEVQALAQIGLADLDAVDVVVLSPWAVPSVHRIERDPEAIGQLLDVGEGWWHRHMVRGEAPALDDSEAARRALSALRGTEERQADARQAELLEELRRVRAAVKRLEGADRLLVRDIKASMAGTGVLLADRARVAWSPVKGRTTVAWQSVAEGLRSRCTPDEWETVVSLATTVGEPGDRFAVTFEEEAE